MRASPEGQAKIGNPYARWFGWGGFCVGGIDGIYSCFVQFDPLRNVTRSHSLLVRRRVKRQACHLRHIGPAGLKCTNRKWDLFNKGIGGMK